MSGSISFLSRANEAINALGTLAFGATGGVVLGDFSFDGFEVPESIRFGGEQRMAVKTLPGGDRIIDLMGPDEHTIEWSGTFLDNDPASRAAVLDQMRIDGNPLPLTWGSFCYTVIIQSVSFDNLYSKARYRISCLVVRNEAAASAGSQLGLTGAIGADMASAIGVSPADMVSGLQYMQANIQNLQTLVPGSQAIGKALAYTGVAQSAVKGASIASGNMLSLLSAAAL